MMDALRLRLARWISPEKKNTRDHVAALADIGDLERAIEIVAAAMPEIGKADPALNTCFTAADAIRQLINGGSLIASCDWELHPTHVIQAEAQRNGRLLLSIRERSSFQQEGNQ
jgi:hypothetical protein